MLPLHPAHARIVNGTMWSTSGQQPLSAEKLQNILCLAYPKMVVVTDDEPSARPPLYKTADAQPIWWLIKDEKVDFQDPWGRWYLADREIESYECI